MARYDGPLAGGQGGLEHGIACQLQFLDPCHEKVSKQLCFSRVDDHALRLEGRAHGHGVGVFERQLDGRRLAGLRDGVEMPEEIIEYVAKNIKSNVRELEGALISLIAQSSFNKREVTIELAKQVVEKFVKNVKREISIDYIQKIVSDYFQLDVETLQSKTRKRHVVQARQLAMFFAKKFTKASLANIGSQIGDRDHATVLHACKTVDNLVTTDKQFRKFVDDINKKLSL